MTYILAIDQGTTSSRAIMFDAQANIMAVSQKEFKQYFPKPGWVEHDPEEIWATVLGCCRDVISKLNLNASDITGIGITNQRETTVVWDRRSGKTVYPAIVWQDRRTADTCKKLKTKEGIITQKTGLLVDPYFSATKIQWILENVDDQHVDNLAFGTIDTYLLWKLTGGKVHATDATNASRTLLFNLETQDWDQELLDIFSIPPTLLPEVKNSCDNFGKTDKALFDGEIPILAVAGDQQAALIGQGCFKPGDIKSTYGTGCFVVLNTGHEIPISSNRLLSTVAYRLEGKPTYAIEGSIFSAGVIIKWLRDQLGIIKSSSETEDIAASLTDNGEVYFVPAFTGLGAPYWDPNARASILGMTRGTRREHIVRASLESIAYQSRDLLVAMEADTSTTPTSLCVDGGMVANNWLMQFLADIVSLPIKRAVIKETTALGVAYLVGLQSGVYKSLEEIIKLCQYDAEFIPKMGKNEGDNHYHHWLVAVNKILEGSDGSSFG